MRAAADSRVRAADRALPPPPHTLPPPHQLIGAGVGDVVSLENVLLWGNAQDTLIGRPTVDGVTVTAGVEEQFRDATIIVHKKKRRKGYQRTNGHRQQLTKLRVLDIAGGEEAASAADRWEEHDVEEPKGEAPN